VSFPERILSSPVDKARAIDLPAFRGLDPLKSSKADAAFAVPGQDLLNAEFR